MLRKGAKIQLVVFAIVGIVAMVFTGVKYAKLGASAGIGRYTVTAAMKDSGGIFTNAEVTYQGVPVGRVSKLKLTDTGVDVLMQLNSGAPKVPSSATAVVANRSAIGEQYIDLQPTSGSGPYLHDGSVITKSSVPPPLQDVVSSAINFTQSVPVDDLHTVVTELGKAFNGHTEDLTRLVDSLSKLAKSGHDNLGDTLSLLRNANVVLTTQAQQSDAILSWAHNLDLITATLASSDPDVRRLLTNGTATATQLSALLKKSGGDITTVLKQLGSTVHKASPTFYTADMTMAMISAISADSSPATGDGQIHFGIVLETNNPPACTQGYEGTQQMIQDMKRKNPSFDIHYDDYPFRTDTRCTVPVGNPTDVRGAARAPLANPADPQPWDNTPKKDPDKLNLTPIASQIAALLGVHPR